MYLVHDPDAPGMPAYGIKTKGACPFNEGVECSTFLCDGCGFNPERKRGSE